MPSSALYMTSYPHFITTVLSIYYIATLYSWHQSYYISHHTLYMIAHPLYLCLHTQIIDHITPIVYMISQPVYVWHTMNYIWHHSHSLWYLTSLWHHTHCIHVITPSICDIASTEPESLLIVYCLKHTCSMCDIKPTVCMTLYEFYMTAHLLFMTSKFCIHDITSSLFMTSHPFSLISLLLYQCGHTSFIDDISAWMDVITLGVCVTSYKLYMTSHALFMISHHSMTSHRYSCHYTQYICHLINWSCFITYNVLIILQLLYLWHRTLYKFD